MGFELDRANAIAKSSRGVPKRKSFGLLVAMAMCASVVVVFSASPARGQTSAVVWDQLGPDIDGEAAGDRSGRRLAISDDGNRVAIGTSNNDDNGTNSGHVRVWERVGASWVQVGDDIDGEAEFDGSGASVAISADGNRVAIGATGSIANGNFSRVRVFDWTGIAWIQVGADIDGEAVGDVSGTSVDISADGNRVAIGANRNDGNGNDSGHVRIWELVGSNWVKVGADIDGENAEDRSGGSVAISADGNRVAIGASRNDGNGDWSGHVRIFDWTGIAWIQVGSDIDGEAAVDSSGARVAISADGNRVAIGAGGNDGNGTDSGHVRIFDWTGIAWIQVGADIDGEAEFDASGAVAISADGNRVAIGAFRNNGNGTDSGHVRIWELSGSTWVQVGADINGEAADDESGFSVAISADGNRVAIGATRNDGNGTDSGHVRVFEPALFCNGLVVDVDLGAGETPTAGDDVILGTAFANLIVAGTGNDTICGGGGDDTINAGPGDDWVDAGDGDDTVFGLAGEDTIFGGAGIDELLGQADDDEIFGGPGNDTVNGGPGDDQLEGGDGNDTVFGVDGEDLIFGGPGNDILVGQGDDDTIFGDSFFLGGAGGNDRINGGPGNDAATGGPGNDNVFGLSGNDTLNGGTGDDFVHGFDGNDILDGGEGDDLVLGTGGKDTFNETSGVNTLNGGPGDDIINGGTGADTIFGDGDLNQGGNDTITGGDDVDLIIAFSGDDDIDTSGDGEIDTVNAEPHNAGDTCTADFIDVVFLCNP